MSDYTVEAARAVTYDERFGYESRGQFQCIRKNENLFIILIGTICLLIPCIVTAVVFSLKDHVSQLLLCASTSILAFVIFISLGIVLIRLVMFGNEYSYSADEQKMTIWGGERTVDIFYSNVVCVRYEPIMLLKTKQRGFRVTVITKKSTLIYNMVYRRFDATMTPATTPFRLLEERAGLLKAPDIDAAVQRRLSRMQEQGKPMEDFVPERPAAKLQRTKVTVNESKISYVKSEEDFLISKGRFTALHPRKTSMLIYMLLADLTSTAVFVILILKHHNLWLLLINAVIWLVFAVIFAAISRSKYTYIANGREFRITDSRGRTETIYYCDAVDVQYKPLKFLWRDRGYRVYIVTKYRTISYNCLFLSNKRYQQTADLPFQLIKERIK